MARRYTPEQRDVAPDPKYHSMQLQSFINRVMHSGKKSTAASCVYDALEIVADKTKKDPMELFEQVLRNVAPAMEVRPRRVGGATYQVPMEVPPDRQFALATRWLVGAARSRSGKNFAEKLAAECLDALNKTGNAVKKREETHKMAEANRAFSHYRL
ncbi:MAG: 30S ribosomal protein S7 [Chloroflexota bacterium]|jgi:small subunit ribosomal protein S7